MDTRLVAVSRGQFNLREGGNVDGFPVVMLHGWPESSYCWEGVAPLMDPSLRIIAPDLRGLGDSERTMDVEAYRKAELARDIIDIVDELGVADFFLVGHDWGGVVAQELAILAPERVRRLVVMNILVLTNPKGTSEAMQRIYSMGGLPFWYQYFQLQPGLPEAMIKGKEDVWVSYFFGKAGRNGAIPPEAIAEYIRCYKIENTPATAASLYRTMALDAKRWGAFADEKFSMPSLYIHGNRDPVIIRDFLNHIEEGFDSIRVESIDASHFVQEERPHDVARILNGFFREQS